METSRKDIIGHHDYDYEAPAGLHRIYHDRASLACLIKATQRHKPVQAGTDDQYEDHYVK